MNKKKILIILIILIIVLVALFIVRYMIEKNKKENKVYNTIEDFKTAEDVMEYYGGEYVNQVQSNEENFKYDVYVKFKYDLYTNENSNEKYYNNVMDVMSYVLDYNSFRLIDAEKEMLIAVVCDNENGRIKKKYINGDSNYFGNAESEKNLSNMEEIRTTNIEIQSPELIELINNNWKYSSVNLGVKTGTLENYDIYENEGIQARKVYKKVFNIVFKEKYKKPIVNGITTGMTNEEIIEILGEPAITDNKNTSIIGYKGQNIYVFFNSGEISIYRIDNYETAEFKELIKEYKNDGNIKKFVSSLTDIWPDYDQYNYNENLVNLIYTLKGVKIQFNVTKNHGIILYNNCDEKLLDIAGSEENKNLVFFENINTLLENEIIRADYYIPDIE